MVKNNCDHDLSLLGQYSDGKCKECVRLRVRKYTLNNKEKVKASNKRYRSMLSPEKVAYGKKRMWVYWIKGKFGITEAQYLEILYSQNQCCAICEKHQSNFKIRFSVDHDHKTGKWRGLLCGPCNRHLGFIENSIWFDKAKKYLVKENYVTKIDQLD